MVINMNSLEILSRSGSAMKAAAKELTGIAKRELEMIPKYLELASVNGKDRFSKQEIKELTEKFTEYDTNMSKSDLVKDLLSVGADKEKTLSAEEISDFLTVSTDRPEQEQKNIFRFVKAAKESSDSPLVFSDFYEDYVMNNSRVVLTNKYYCNVVDSHRVDPLDKLFSGKMPQLVSTVASSSNPEKLAQIMQIAGVNNTTINSGDALGLLHDMSGGNKHLVADMAHLFVPKEVKQIADKFANEGKDISLLKKYGENRQTRPGYYSTCESLRGRRIATLKELDLSQQIKSYIKYKKGGDVFGSGKLTTGNFEGGKRR